MLSLEFAQLTDCGRVREHNEDYIGHVAPDNETQARSRGWLFALADGVGGSERGEVASRTAVENITAGFREASTANENHASLLGRLVQNANSAVYEAGQGAMATTLVACTLRFDRVVVAHVGDSRCYLIRRGTVRSLTRDHTVANEQLNLGGLSSRRGSKAMTRHILSRSIGSGLFVAPDISEHLLATGDMLLLCSDGLHGAVSAAGIARVLAHMQDLEVAAQELVAIANECDGSDNVSVQLVRVRGVERIGMYRGRPYRLR